MNQAPQRNPFKTLRQFTRPKAKVERCELCNVGLASNHRHLLEISMQRPVCACDPCALRFHDVVGGRFKLIPRDARALPQFQLTDSEWDALALPINLAFFFYSTPQEKRTVLYPSPAGATESLLPLTAWEALVERNPVLSSLQKDAEALLVNRIGKTRQYYIAPIDACYELVGLIRMHWRGLSGGELVWKKIDAFFAGLENRGRC